MSSGTPASCRRLKTILIRSYGIVPLAYKLSDNIDGLIYSANNLGPGDTPIAMAWMIFGRWQTNYLSRDTINPPQIAAKIASYVRRD